MQGEQNPLIDKTIDDTARELTEGRPHAALRTNVAARIAGHQSSPWRLALSVGGAAAAVVMVVALMWPARVEDSDPVPAAMVVQDRQDIPVGRALSGSPGEPDRVRPTSDVVARKVVASEPSSTTEELTVESLEVVTLDVDELEVPTLTVEALTVEPLPLQ